MILNKFLYHFDWVAFFITIFIGCIGLLFVFSATTSPEQAISIFFKKQAAGLAIGIGIYLACTIIDYRALMRWGYIGFMILIGVLFFTLIKGSIGMGAQRWINLGFIKLQPSELAKILFPAYTAYYFFIYKKKTRSLRDFAPLLGILGLSFILILKQPDLGTALIIAFSGLTLFWLAGLPKKFFIIGFIICIIGAPVFWHVLKPYQKKRIEVFLGYGDSNKERYQIEQALIAIGSGGITGKGLLHGTQNVLQFLPEARTDFIFAVVCEEWGLLGALFIILLYLFLFLRLLVGCASITMQPIQILAVGLLIHLVFSTFVNILMVLGLLPVVGIPLPLISYGLSNLWTSMASLGWLQGILMEQRHLRAYSKYTPVRTQ